MTHSDLRLKVFTLSVLVVNEIMAAVFCIDFDLPNYYNARQKPVNLR